MSRQRTIKRREQIAGEERERAAKAPRCPRHTQTRLQHGRCWQCDLDASQRAQAEMECGSMEHWRTHAPPELVIHRGNGPPLRFRIPRPAFRQRVRR